MAERIRQGEGSEDLPTITVWVWIIMIHDWENGPKPRIAKGMND